MMHDRKKQVVITGATDGIGKALAKIFAEHGYHVIALVRNLEKARELHSYGEIELIATDLSQPEQLHHLPAHVFTETDIFINNAGMSFFKPFVELQDDQILSIAHVNFLSPLRLSRRFLEVARPDACLVNVTSITAQLPMVNNSVYSACKAAMAQATALMRLENHKAIRIIEFCPGSIATPFHQKAGGVANVGKGWRMTADMAAKKLFDKIHTKYQGTLYPDIVSRILRMVTPRCGLFVLRVLYIIRLIP